MLLKGEKEFFRHSKSETNYELYDMVVKVKGLTAILNDELSMVERGILITILLLRDDDPTLFNAKIKAKIKIAKYRQELLNLHDNGYIEWKGAARARKLLKEVETTPEVRECIIFFNNLCKRGFDFTSSNTTKHLRNRLLDHSVEEIKLVIANRYANWKDDPKMSQHLNPTTLFRPSKFPKYLEAALRTKEGSGFVNAEKIDLNKGDEITYEKSRQLIDEDIYHIKVFTIDKQGNKKNPTKQKLPGTQIKYLLNVQHKRVERGDQKEFYYEYNQ